MTEYLETGENGFNGYLEGLPKGEITLLMGDVSKTLLLWSEVLSVENTTIYSEYRDERILKERYENIVNDVKNIPQDTQLIIIEADSVFQMNTDLLKTIRDKNIPLLVVSNQPDIQTRSNSHVVLEERTELQNMDEVNSKLIVHRHMSQSFEDTNQVYDVNYKPLPFIDDNIQH